MSTPRNHHYVSRCLVNNFFDSEGYIHLFDKDKGIYSSNNSSKGIFSEKDLNAFINDNGEIDYSEVENYLNLYFEQDFPKLYKKIKELAAERTYNKLEEMAESGELAETIYYLIKMGVVGEPRTPRNKKHLDNVFSNIFTELVMNATDEFKASLKSQLGLLNNENSHLPYNTPGIDYKELSDEVLKGMGDVIVSIAVAPEGAYFLLPDCTSIRTRTKMPDDIVDGQRFINPAEPIIFIAMPLESKIFIMVTAKSKSVNKEHQINFVNPEIVFDINCDLFKVADKMVACESKEYLKSFIDKLLIKN